MKSIRLSFVYTIILIYRLSTQLFGVGCVLQMIFKLYSAFISAQIQISEALKIAPSMH